MERETLRNTRHARHAGHDQRHVAGFTLIELMISLTVGGIALGSIYAVGSASTRFLREQQRVSSTQTAVRIAMEQIKRDLQRAGFLATPNAALQGEACAAPSNTVAAITDYEDNIDVPAGMISTADDSVYNSSGEVTFDDLVLMGNYSTSGEYVVSANSTNSEIRLARGWQSFRRDFSDWTDASSTNYVPALFEQAFREDRMLRLHTQDERFYFANIESNDATAGTDPIVRPDIPVANCNVVGGWISPLNAIRYHVVAASAADRAGDGIFSGVARLAARDSAVGPFAVLRRTETQGADHHAPLLDGDGEPVEDRAVLDYVVSFNVSFRGSGGTPNAVNWTPVAESVVQATPEQIRTAIIDVAARTPEQTPSMAIIPAAPLRSFIVFDQNTRPGAARVRSERAEVLLPNIALRKL
jgi:prepilin-type N-terminal cleavage/methylation domain-containing protein